MILITQLHYYEHRLGSRVRVHVFAGHNIDLFCCGNGVIKLSHIVVYCSQKKEIYLYKTYREEQYISWAQEVD